MLYPKLLNEQYCCEFRDCVSLNVLKFCCYLYFRSIQKDSNSDQWEASLEPSGHLDQTERHFTKTRPYLSVWLVTFHRTEDDIYSLFSQTLQYFSNTHWTGLFIFISYWILVWIPNCDFLWKLGLWCVTLVNEYLLMCHRLTVLILFLNYENIVNPWHFRMVFVDSKVFIRVQDILLTWNFADCTMDRLS